MTYGFNSIYNLETFSFQLNSQNIHIDYIKNIDDLIDLISEEEFDEDERLPYWADIWPSAYALALYSQNIECRHKKVLELGSGVGLAGIAFGVQEAFVTFSDYEEEALKFCAHNAEQNNLSDFKCINIDWRNPQTGDEYDFIIGADIVYEERQFTPVIHMLKTYLTTSGKAYIAEPNRNVAHDFFDRLTSAGFSYQKYKQEIIFNSKKRFISICEIY